MNALRVVAEQSRFKKDSTFPSPRALRSAGLFLLLFQAYLWWGFLAATHRPKYPGLEAFDTVSYTTGTAANIAILILIAVRREPIWLAALWLTVTFSQLTVNFSVLYWSHGSSPDFSSPLTHLDAIYFTLGTLSTAGTGSLSAVGRAARGIQTLQFVLDLGLVLFAVSVLVSRFAPGRQAPPGSAARRSLDS